MLINIFSYYLIIEIALMNDPDTIRLDKIALNNGKYYKLSNMRKNVLAYLKEFRKLYKEYDAFSYSRK